MILILTSESMNEFEDEIYR